MSVQQRDLLPSSLYDGTEPSEPRTLLLAELDGDLGRILCGSTHLPRSSLKSRQQAAEQLSAILTVVKLPWIVCGDFNQSAALTLNDRQVTVAPESEPTYPVPNPVESIDYLLAFGIDIHGKVLPCGDSSDHQPIEVDARLLS
jgi:endonuclease/exonuclease/phosphatase family metal-dependent hydrolase